MNKITGFIKKHKKLVIGLVILVILILVGILLKVTLFSSSGDVYGNRLKDVDKYKISEKTTKSILKELEDQTSVKSAEYSNEGRVLTYVIILDAEIKVDDAKKYADIVLDGLKDKYKKYYDIQVMYNTEKETETYPIAGYKSKSRDNFVWSGIDE